MHLEQDREVELILRLGAKGKVVAAVGPSSPLEEALERTEGLACPRWPEDYDNAVIPLTQLCQIRLARGQHRLPPLDPLSLQ